MCRKTDREPGPVAEENSDRVVYAAKPRVLLIEDEALIGIHVAQLLDEIGGEMIGPIEKFQPRSERRRRASSMRRFSIW